MIGRAISGLLCAVFRKLKLASYGVVLNDAINAPFVNAQAASAFMVGNNDHARFRFLLGSFQ